jgi:glutaredoxin-like YruB-family protein
MANITIYSTPSCVYCKMAKQYFKENNLPYTEHNVQEDMQAQQEMIAKSHQLGVPVIDVDGEIFVGFDKKGLAEVLKIGQ